MSTLIIIYDFVGIKAYPCCVCKTNRSNQFYRIGYEFGQLTSGWIICDFCKKEKNHDKLEVMMITSLL